jgi:hypothetical protein
VRCALDAAHLSARAFARATEQGEGALAHHPLHGVPARQSIRNQAAGVHSPERIKQRVSLVRRRQVGRRETVPTGRAPIPIRQREGGIVEQGGENLLVVIEVAGSCIPRLRIMFRDLCHTV